MRSNEFEINKFTGVINSVVNPDPKTSSVVNNFDVYTIEGALQTRRGIKKYLDVNLKHLPRAPDRIEYVGFCTYFSQEFNREFIVLLANKKYQTYYGNIEYCSFNIYPTFIKQNNQYTLINEWNEINQFSIYEVQNIHHIAPGKRIYLNSILGLNEEIQNSFIYWTGIVVDENTKKVKNVFYVSGEHQYNNETGDVILNLDDDYNIKGGDILIFLKNFVKIKSNLFGEEDFYGIIPRIEKPQFVINDTGINILSQNLEVFKICLDFFVLKNVFTQLNQVYDTKNYIKDSNFNNVGNNWIIENGEVSIIDYRNVVKIQNSATIRGMLETRDFFYLPSGHYSISIEFKFDGNFNVVYHTLSLWRQIDGRPVFQSSLVSNARRTEKKDKWYRATLTTGYVEENNYKISIIISPNVSEQGTLYISSIRISKTVDRIDLIQVNNFNNNSYTPNEPFANNGFYVSNIVPDLITDNFDYSIRPFYELYYTTDHPHSSIPPSQDTLIADRIIASLNNVNELCVLQRKRDEAIPDDFSNQIINRQLFIRYFLLNRRITEFTAFFGRLKGSNVMNKDYYELSYYKVKTVFLQYPYLDGTIQGVYQLSRSSIELTNYLGYEAGETIIKEWRVQENNYIANCKVKDNYLSSIFYSAINGNGVIMSDIFPIGNIIQIPYEGDAIRGLLINRYKYLIIIKNNAVFILDIDTNALARLSSTDGVVNEQSFASDGYNVFIADYDGLKLTDGTRIVNITKNVNNLDYLSVNKQNIRLYINPNFNTLNILVDNYYELVYPVDNPYLNYKRTLPIMVTYVWRNLSGEILYLSDNGKLFRQTRIDENFYADENSLEPLVFETNEFDIVSLGEQFPNYTRISVNEIFIDYISHSPLSITLIGDGNIINSYNIQASSQRKLRRIQIVGGQTKNLFRSIKLRINRAAYYGGDFENIAYTRIYSIGFSYLPQQITRDFNG